MIDQQTIDRILAAANIVDVISDYVTLRKAGVNYKACCPFHDEKTPSFVVSPAKGLYKCFGCGKGGNVFSFIMEHEGVSWIEAVRIVGKKYGIEVRERELTDEEKNRNDNRESMFALNTWAMGYFSSALNDTEEGLSVGMTYFRQKRGFSAATIRKFGLGYCPGEGRKMTQDALKAGYKEEFLLSTGLSIRSDYDSSLRDRFRERVMFPIHSISGRIVGFGGRTLRTDKNVAKYQNSVDSEIYVKRNELYGLYFAKKAIQQADYAIMVEGYADVISMHQSGIENVVASSGTSLTKEQIRLVQRFTQNLTLMYDGDSAGIHAAVRGIDMVLAEGLNVRIVLLPPEDDPDSFAQSHSATEVREYISSKSEDFIAFKTKLLLSDSGDDPLKRAQVTREIVTSIAQIPDNIKRSEYIKMCSRLMDVDQNMLISEVARTRVSSVGDKTSDEFVRRQMQDRLRSTAVLETSAQATASRLGSMPIGSSLYTLEKELCTYLLKYGTHSYTIRESGQCVDINVASEIIRSLDEDGMNFADGSFRMILDHYRKCLSDGRYPEPHEFINYPDPGVADISVDLLTSGDNYQESDIWTRKEVHIASENEILGKGIPKAISLFKLQKVKAMIEEVSKAITAGSCSPDELKELMHRLTELNDVKVLIAKKNRRNIV